MNKTIKYALPILLIGLLALKVPLVVGMSDVPTTDIGINKLVNDKIVKLSEDDNSTSDGDDGDHMGDGGSDDHMGDHNGEMEHDDEEHMMIGMNGSIKSDDNEISFESEKPRIKYKYYLKLDNTTMVRIEIKVEGNKIYEFKDTNGNGKVDSDEILQVFEMDDHYWQMNMTMIKDANGSLLYVLYSYEYSDGAKHIMVNFYVFNKSHGMYDGSADKVKVELLIDSWDWKDNSSVLAYKFEAKVALEKKHMGGMVNATTGYNDHSVFINVDNKAFVEFSWNTTVVIDGTPMNVTNSYWTKVENEFETEEGETEVEIEMDAIVVFPRFNSTLYYDPIVGVEDDPADVAVLQSLFGGNVGGFIKLDGFMILVGVIAGLILLGSAFVLRRRK